MKFDFKQDLYYTYRYDPYSEHNLEQVENNTLRNDIFISGYKYSI